MTTPIKPQNLAMLDEMDSKLKERGFIFIDQTLSQSIDSIKEFRKLQITTIGFSLAIAGVVIPLLVSKDMTSIVKDHLFLAIVLFGANVAWGIIAHATQLSSERKSIWQNADVRLKEMDGLRNEIQRIRKMDDNDEAGRTLINLRVRVENVKESNMSGLNNFVYLVEMIFFGLFIAGLAITFISLAKIFLD